MNERKVHLSMERFIYYIVAVILLLCGITYLLSSCSERVIIEGPGSSGPKVDVNVTLIIGMFSSNTNVEPEIRSSRYSEPASEIVHLANDVYMYATLEEEHPVRTRAGGDTIDLKEGALVRVIAYSGSSFATEEAYVDFEVVSGKLVPVGNGFSIPNDTYKFAAYTFNDANPLPPHTSPVNFNAGTYPDRYLMWGITDPTPVPSLTNSDTVAITVGHLFSRVKIVASTAQLVNPTRSINKIVGAQLSPSYSNLSFNPASGTLTPSSSTPENTLTEFTRWREVGDVIWRDTTYNLNAPIVESDYFLIYPHAANPMTLWVSNLVAGNRDNGDYQWRFSDSQIFPMIGGGSYVLTLNFKRLIWAGSNIFWDGTKLTFYEEGTPTPLQGLQGVYFLWGSLVGISPNGAFVNNTTPIYMPDPSTYTWSNTTGVLGSIPRISGGSLYSPVWLDNHQSRNYLYNEVHAPNSLLGDICHYLTQSGDAPAGGSWRMPNAREFGLDQSDYFTGNLSSITIGTVSTAGITDFYDSQTNPGYRSFIGTSTASYSTIFPAGGSRDHNGNIIQATRYMSGSPTYNPTGGNNPNLIDASFSMYILQSWTPQVSLNVQTPLGYQGLVRCVKIEGDGGIPIHWTTPTVDVEDWDDGGTFGQGDTAGQGDVLY